MSLVYLFKYLSDPLYFGSWRIGRMIDLMQLDFIIVFLAVMTVFEIKRWNRIKTR